MASTPMVPPAPGRLSMMMDWPRRCSNCGCTARAIRSVEPPGGNVTMRRIGLAGKDSAASALLTHARTTAANIAATPAHILRTPTSFIGTPRTLKSKRSLVRARIKSATGWEEIEGALRQSPPVARPPTLEPSFDRPQNRRHRHAGDRDDDDAYHHLVGLEPRARDRNQKPEPQ